MGNSSSSASAAVAPSTSQPSFTYTPTAEEAELLRLSQEWMDALLLHKDETRLREIMAPEYTLQVWDVTRAPQPLEAWMHTGFNRLKETQLEYTALNAQVFGDVGVVYSRFRWSGSLDGTPFKDAGFMVDVWRRRDSRWQVVSRRSAPGQQVQLAVAEAV